MMQEKHHSASSLFVFLLLGLFAVFATLLVMLGAQCYQRATADADILNATRIVRSVARSAVHSDDAGMITVEDLDGVTALCITMDTGDDEYYVKRLYCYNGYLMELFTESDTQFRAEAGETLCKANVFFPSIEGDLLTVAIDCGSGLENSYIALRAEGY